MGATRLGMRPLRGRELTPREFETVALVVEGLTNAEIARRLDVTLSTAQAHVASAMGKVGARTRTQLAVDALRRGLVPLGPPRG